jgi:hypothetical protein
VADADNLDVEFSHSPEGGFMLFLVQAKGWPTRFKPRPRNDCVATKKYTPLGPVEGEVPGGMSWCMHHVQRPNPVALVDVLVDLTWGVLAKSKRCSELKREIRPQRPLGNDRHRLGCSLTANDVRLPFVRIDSRARPLA